MLQNSTQTNLADTAIRLIMITKQTPTKVSSDPFATKLSDPANECASHLQNMHNKYTKCAQRRM